MRASQKALESHFPERAEAQPEESSADHCSEGGLTEKATGYWCLGSPGDAAVAMEEALMHLTRGLEVFRGLTESLWRRKCELDLTAALGKAQIATQGYAVASTGEMFSRARALCEPLGDPPQLLSVLHGLWTHALLRGELEAARSQALDLLERGEERGDSVAVDGLPIQRRHAPSAGGVRPGPPFLKRGFELYDPTQIVTYAMITVDDPRVVMLAYLSWWPMCTGALRSEARGAEALSGRAASRCVYAGARAERSLVHRIDDRFSRGRAAASDELMPLLEEHGIAYYGAVGTLFRGYCLAALGEAAEAEVPLQNGMTAYRATGSGLYRLGLPAHVGRSVWTHRAMSIALECIPSVPADGSHFAALGRGGDSSRLRRSAARERRSPTERAYSCGGRWASPERRGPGFGSVARHAILHGLRRGGPAAGGARAACADVARRAG